MRIQLFMKQLVLMGWLVANAKRRILVRWNQPLRSRRAM